jgi:hypothetical protein
LRCDRILLLLIVLSFWISFVKPIFILKLCLEICAYCFILIPFNGFCGIWWFRKAFVETNFIFNYLIKQPQVGVFWCPYIDYDLFGFSKSFHEIHWLTDKLC